MFFPSRPSDQRIREIIEIQRNADFSYEDVGATKGLMPSGYKVLHRHLELGRGAERFALAIEAIRRWKTFDFPGVWIYPPDARIERGTTVAVLVKHFGFWSVNCCRIVYVLDEDGPVQRFGFAYGTLPDHAQQGEERFMIEWDRSSEMVSFDILSFSRPRHWLAKVGYPAARRLQKRFVENSLSAMTRAVKIQPQKSVIFK
jgi:uncharacterized protein (UPF0548 family)